MVNRVYLSRSDTLVKKMFKEEGWEVVTDPEKANLICYTGGSDVSPMLYSNIKNPKTMCDPVRDQEEVDLYVSQELMIPQVGICRGAQFLNIMNNGELFQDIDNHNSGTHKVKDNFNNAFEVTSTHHQAMIPSPYEADKALVILEADISTHKELYDSRELTDKHKNMKDIEVIFYEPTDCLCFQPHPEDVGKDHECRRLFFALLSVYLGLEEEDKKCAA